MDVREVVEMLGWTREEVLRAITDGYELPKSKRLVLLTAVKQAGKNKYDVTEEDLDAFIEAFHDEEPSRHPPVAVRRALRLEANHKCAACRENVVRFEFHHMKEFSQLAHYDVNHMLALCPDCHAKCTRGVIEREEQYEYKTRLRGTSVATTSDPFFGVQGPARFGWDDLRDVISALGTLNDAQKAQGSSKTDFDYVELARKNELNNFGDAAFDARRQHHEPYFHKIDDFLGSPLNHDSAAIYFQLVDELRNKIAARANAFSSFEEVLLHFEDVARESGIPELRSHRRATSILLSYMYFNCDIGRKA